MPGVQHRTGGRYCTAQDLRPALLGGQERERGRETGEGGRGRRRVKRAEARRSWGSGLWGGRRRGGVQVLFQWAVSDGRCLMMGSVRWLCACCEGVVQCCEAWCWCCQCGAGWRPKNSAEEAGQHGARCVRGRARAAKGESQCRGLSVQRGQDQGPSYIKRGQATNGGRWRVTWRADGRPGRVGERARMVPG